VPHKLLLADDSVTIQRVIELTFAEEDITVVAVGDGRQAIERVQSDRPDIVLADVGMPERDGYEVATFIKGSPDLAHIPVLLLTGAFEPIDEGRAQAAGCDGVLVKPFEPQMVISRVKDLLAGRRPVQKMPAPDATSEPRQEPVAAAPVAAPAAAAPPIESGDTAAQPSADTIEEYFDRLDAAFASLDGPSGAAPAPTATNIFRSSRTEVQPTGHAGLADELATWDPDLGGSRPGPHEAPAVEDRAALEPPADRAPAAPERPAPPAAAVPAQPPSLGPVPTLAEAFAALLAAEQGTVAAASAIPREALNDDVVEQVTRRVIERLGDGAVRQVVIDVAERLVLEEIERIKASAR
jgi:CheY-like chemotaxis protein